MEKWYKLGFKVFEDGQDEVLYNNYAYLVMDFSKNYETIYLNEKLLRLWRSRAIDFKINNMDVMYMTYLVIK